MELLQSLLTTTYPSFTTLLKFFFTQIIDIAINALTTYPVNLLLCISFIFVAVYSSLSSAFKENLFRAKYKPLPHKQNLVNDMKLLKKQIREIQTDIIDIRKKLTSSQPQQEQQLHFEQPKHNNNPHKNTQLQKQIKQKIHQGQESIRFNQALEKSLKDSNDEIVRTLKEINDKNN